MASVCAESYSPFVDFQRASSEDDICILDHKFFLVMKRDTSEILTLPLKVERKGLGFSNENSILTAYRSNSAIYLRF